MTSKMHSWHASFRKGEEQLAHPLSMRLDHCPHVGVKSKNKNEECHCAWYSSPRPPQGAGSSLPNFNQAGRLRRAKPSPTSPSAKSVKTPGSGTFPTDACTLALMAVGKSSKLFTGRTQGLEVMGFGGSELIAKRVPQP